MGSSCSWFGVGVQCEELRVLLECGSVVVVVVRCFRLRASVFVFALGARVVLHDVRTSILARLGGQRFLRRFLRVFDARGACGHRPAVARCQACDRAAVVASLHSFAVLLALVRIATGAWFAGMNFSVHPIMCGCFAVTGTNRNMVSPFAIHITLLQLVQMLVGMFVTMKAVLYQAAGEECHVNKTNSVLGLAMYSSYFILFFKLFVDKYYLKPRGSRLFARS
mmetsp:Transcript_78063/g.253289  ORF Transcript_78063/g.253289 Transcript_78063/m.253289 type:complete len:223 (-) Transcript_78063:313-981(-)